jgi:hypothetical protein
MRIDDLPSPGQLSNGIKLRIEAAKAISSIELTAARTPGGKVSGAAIAVAFFTACADALAGFVDTTTPTMAGATGVAVSAVKVTLDFVGTDMDEGVVPAAAAFALNNGGTVTAVAWGTAGDAGKLVLTTTGAAAADELTYTKPSSGALRDKAGNQVASGVNTLS